MDERHRQALAEDPVVDITTTGRKTGKPRRIEIWIHDAGGRYIITGSPGRRDWYANLLAEPGLVVHLKRSAHADLPARATPITDPAEKATLLRAAPRLARYVNDTTIAEWLEKSPMVEVTFG
ncbi:MAG: hypothetical protein Kow0010_21980 [Dehalococcoidia bacterium]